MSEPLDSPLERWPGLGDEVGVDLWVKRDDLLPFPLAGNKVRKLLAEQQAAGWRPGDLLVTNGGVASNHCRTLALLGARAGCRVHLVLHSEDPADLDGPALRLLRATGATYDVVPAQQIGPTISAVTAAHSGPGRVVVVPGGAHTPAAVAAYRDAGQALLRSIDADQVVVACGTGATQAGLVLAAAGTDAHVRGISVARGRGRAVGAVRECLEWFDGADLPVEVDDRFVDGGYGRFSEATRAAVELGWRRGLPLDPVYTGKAFRGLLELVRGGEIQPGSRVVLWHTGGLANFIESYR